MRGRSESSQEAGAAGVGGASRIVGSEVGEVIEVSAHRARRSHSEDCEGDGRPWRAGN